VAVERGANVYAQESGGVRAGCQEASVPVRKGARVQKRLLCRVDLRYAPLGGAIAGMQQ